MPGSTQTKHVVSCGRPICFWKIRYYNGLMEGYKYVFSIMIDGIRNQRDVFTLPQLGLQPRFPDTIPPPDFGQGLTLLFFIEYFFYC